MKLYTIPVWVAALSIVSVLHAVKLELNVKNQSKGKITVEIYEKPPKGAARWDEDVAPAWEGRIYLAKDGATTYLQNLDEGEYQISAYYKTRAKSLPKTVNFTIQENNNSDIKPLSVIVTDDGVSQQ